MSGLRRASVVVACVGLSASALGSVINFDSVASGTNVDTYYPGVIFSSEAGYTTVAYAYVGPSPFSAPNVLTPYFTAFNIPSPVRNLYADFTTPVNGLSFLAVAADEYGVVARVHVYTTGNVLLGTDNIIGTAAAPNTFGYGSTTVNLSAYSNVTRIEVVPPIGEFSLDSAYGGGGIAYDDFTFEPVPAPSGAAAMGIAALVFGRRRRPC